MDFQRLTRRELQALCKKNKIPANMTNVSMVESLKALEIVEGIEDFLTTCESESVQSSIDSPVMSEVTSPCVPQTGGRTTRRRTATKEEPGTEKPSIRVQRTTRRTLAKDADEPLDEAIETPAIVPQTNRRRRGQMTSACRKIDSQLRECVQEKKDVLVSPAPSGVTTRRRRGGKEESVVQRVYSTRRSARLAEKNMELSNDIANENLDFSKKELFTNDFQNDLDEISGITGPAVADVTMEENSERKDEEVVSSQKQEIYSVNEVELGPTNEEETINNSEETKSELKGSNLSEIEADLEKCVGRQAPSDENKSQENDESHDLQTSEIEIEVEKVVQLTTDEDAGCKEHNVLESKDNDKVAGCEDQAANYSENVVFESEDTSEIAVVSCDIDDHDIIEKEGTSENDSDFEDVTDLNVNKEVLETNGPHDAQPSDIEIEVENIEEENTDKDQATNNGENSGLESDELNTGEDAESDDVLPSEIKMEVDETKEKVTDKYAGNEDEVASSGENPESEVTEDVHEDSSSEKEFKSFDLEATEDDDSLTLDISLMNEEDEASKWGAVFAYVNAVEEEALPGIEMDTVSVEVSREVDTHTTITTSIQPVKKKRSISVSDNKENIGSGGKLVLTKERAKISAKEKTSKNAATLGDMSIRQLTKMLKEKLQITNKLSKSENDNIEVPARPALQALPGNHNAN